MKKLSKYLILVVAIVYTIFPFDIIPDSIFVLGWLDDLGIDAIAIKYFLKTLAVSKATSYIETTKANAASSGDTGTVKLIDNTQKAAKAAASLGASALGNSADSVGSGAGSKANSNTSREMDVF